MNSTKYLDKDYINCLYFLIKLLIWIITPTLVFIMLIKSCATSINPNEVSPPLNDLFLGFYILTIIVISPIMNSNFFDLLYLDGYLKTNADRKIDDLIAERSSCKEQVLAAIEVYGYLNAKVYWDIKRSNEKHIENMKEKNRIKSKYKPLHSEYAN